jgi:Flp pilus assembly protein TadG
MRHRRRQGERGASLIEFALVAPILIVLLFGVVDFGRLAFTKIDLNDAVQEGSIYASTHPGDTSDIQDRVVGGVDSPAIVKPTVVITCPGDKLKVTVTHSMTTIVPLLLPDTFTLTAEVTTDVFTDGSCVAS